MCKIDSYCHAHGNGLECLKITELNFKELIHPGIAAEWFIYEMELSKKFSMVLMRV
jgi:hypothetical protein